MSTAINLWVIWVPIVIVIFVLMYRQKIALEWNGFRTRRKEWLYEKWKNWGEPFLVAAVLAFVIRTFLIGPYKIPTGSMRLTFIEGDRIFADKISYRFRKPTRGDIIIFKAPIDPRKDFVKRLAGLPGDKIEIKQGKLIINGKQIDAPPFSQHYYYNRNDWDYAKEGQIIEVPEGSYFALGDNSAQSNDSRNWGFIPAKNVVGKAICIWWPPKRVKLVN